MVSDAELEKHWLFRLNCEIAFDLWTGVWSPFQLKLRDWLTDDGTDDDGQPWLQCTGEGESS